MNETLQVIGAGLHRTGSMSLKVALERLGFGPCYHGMESLRRNRDGDRWLAAFEAGGNVDWSEIFDGYRSALDWPTIFFWEQLTTAYPDAKVVLTVRDLESWWHSHVRMFEVGSEVVEEFTDDQRQWAVDSGFARMQAALGTIPSAFFDDRLSDKEHCQRVFEEHVARVREAMPKDRLLVYEVQEGWEPLCQFLEVDVPDEPFPRVNVGENLVVNIRTAMRLARAQSGETPNWR